MLLGVASGLKILVWFEGVESCGYAYSLRLEDGFFICKCWKSCGFAQGVHVVGIIFEDARCSWDLQKFGSSNLILDAVSYVDLQMWNGLRIYKRNQDCKL